MIEECNESRTKSKRDLSRIIQEQATIHERKTKEKLQVFKAKNQRLAASPWGKNWNLHLQNFEIHQGRLALGRKICRLGGLFNLAVQENKITACVITNEGTYNCQLKFNALESEKIEALQEICQQELTNLTDLLFGKISESLMTKIVATPHLLPDPQDLKINCNCMDYADLCEHAASILYAFGQHLDEHPEDFFKLRGLDLKLLIRQQFSENLQQPSPMTKDDIGRLFEIELN